MLALQMVVFVLVAQTALSLFKVNRSRWIVAGVLSILFIANAWFNFHRQFLDPVKHEYNVVRNFIDTNYRAGTRTVDFIRPSEDAFEKKYGITRSWDEFGVPSTAFSWVPEFFVKQVLYEKTNNRADASTIQVRLLPGIENTVATDTTVKAGLVVDANALIKNN
jgi:hypothetical protein